MEIPISRIDLPELFFGFVSPIGTDLRSTIDSFSNYFLSHNYRVVEIRLTKLFPELSTHVQPATALLSTPEEDRIRTYTAYGNQLRSHFADDSVLSVFAIHHILLTRRSFIDQGSHDRFARTVYLLNQFKRQEEIDLLRAVYGELFFQVSVYSRRGARVDLLARKFAAGHSSADLNRYRSIAEDIIQIDENETGVDHGQRVGKVFHGADVIFNLDLPQPDHQRKVERFCELLFSSNTISPTKMEFGMFIAKVAALRTLDLSRQVGAAIFTPDADIIAMGANEVPKGDGGSYWSDAEFDDREFRRGFDSNDQRKREILCEIASLLVNNPVVEDLLKKREIKDSQLMDALEYGRIVHAEMSAILDAGRLGRALAGSILYCTTFPCHLCAKHIVAAGIARVIFLEPYPKSLAARLHADSIAIEGGDRGRYQRYPAVSFEHFSGITPRRYREFFERGSRKDSSGSLVGYVGGTPRPFVDVKAPLYAELEDLALRLIKNALPSVLGTAGSVGP